MSGASITAETLGTPRAYQVDQTLALHLLGYAVCRLVVCSISGHDLDSCAPPLSQPLN